MRRTRILLRTLSIALLAGSACVEGTVAANGRPGRCPEPKSGYCTADYNPVVCSGCTYSNACNARSAGFNLEQCVPRKGGKPPQKTCPPPKTDVACTKEHKPVVCNGCTYPNSCYAGAAGFTDTQCASQVPTDAKKTCPEPAAGVVCTTEYAPVTCDGCRYPNACAAGAAGYTKEQCVRAPGD